MSRAPAVAEADEGSGPSLRIGALAVRRGSDYCFGRFFLAAPFLAARAIAAWRSAGDMKATPRASSGSRTTGASPRRKALTRALAAAEGGERWGVERFTGSLSL